MKKSELLCQLKLLYADLLCCNSGVNGFKSSYDIGFINSARMHLEFGIDRLEELIFVLEDKNEF